MQVDLLRSSAGSTFSGASHGVPLLLTPTVFADERGFLFESWNQRSFAEALGLPPEQAPVFVQDNHSRSLQGVLRGLHYQLPPHAQGKLVRCVLGEIFDVVMDLRCASFSFGQWAGAMLSADNKQQLWAPQGFAHGFLTLSAQAEVLYKTSDFWCKECERAIRWDDPQLAIAWPLDLLGGIEPLLADKDGNAILLAEALASGQLFA